MLSRHWMLTVALAVTAATGRATAQTEVAPPPGEAGGCTISCGCTAAMCGCSRTGGSGGACRTDGNTCAVFACPSAMLLPRGAALVLAADGSMVTVGAFVTSGEARVSTTRPVQWRTVSRGHAVGVDCGGAVVSEYFDAATAADLRNHSREIGI
jgi:hypothetical protein